MHVILVYRPEAASPGSDPADDRFDGIEVFQTWDDEELAQESMLRASREHPDWQFAMESLPEPQDQLEPA
jgi:hypothetical protein